MGMPEAVRHWTREEVLALPDDGNRYELVNGELLGTPGPRAIHQRAVLALYRRIHPYVEGHQLGEVMLSPADLDLKRGQSLQPDLFVAPLVEGRRPLDWWGGESRSIGGSTTYRFLSPKLLFPRPPDTSGASSAGSIRRRESPTTGSWRWTDRKSTRLN